MNCMYWLIGRQECDIIGLDVSLDTTWSRDTT